LIPTIGTGIEEENQSASGGYQISTYPNPFIRNTVISCSGIVNGGSKTSIKVYDITGKLVEEIDGIITSKTGVTLGKNLKSGIYFVKVKNCKVEKIIKMKAVK
jgi:hypothetical protein